MAKLKKNSTINGKLIVTEEQLATHTSNNDVHVSVNDKTRWNNKIAIKTGTSKPDKADFWLKVIG